MCVGGLNLHGCWADFVRRPEFHGSLGGRRRRFPATDDSGGDVGRMLKASTVDNGAALAFRIEQR